MLPSSACVFGGTKGAQTALVASFWAPSRVHSEPFLQLSDSLKAKFTESQGEVHRIFFLRVWVNKAAALSGFRTGHYRVTTKKTPDGVLLEGVSSGVLYLQCLFPHMGSG